MAKNMASRFNEDDYFNEPDYEDYTDEELDELYYFGELRSPARKKKALRKATEKKAKRRLFTDTDEDEWLDLDLDFNDEIFEDD